MLTHFKLFSEVIKWRSSYSMVSNHSRHSSSPAWMRLRGVHHRHDHTPIRQRTLWPTECAGYGPAQLAPDLIIRLDMTGLSGLTCYVVTQVDTERSSEWLSVIDATVRVLQHQLALHPDTGLLADFLVYDHSEKTYKPSQGRILERDSDGDFGYNACRYVEASDHTSNPHSKSIVAL